MTKESRSSLGIAKDVVIPLLSVVTAVLVAILNFSISSVKNGLAEQKQLLERQKQDWAEFQSEHERRARETEAERALSMRVYEAVTQSLESGNSKHQEVAKALVVVMLDDPLRERLLAALVEEGEPEVSRGAQQVLEKERQYKREQAEIETPSEMASGSSNSNIVGQGVRYDVFWCESSSSAVKAKAEEVAELLGSQPGAGRTRVRMLPESLRRKPGYGTALGYEIRFESGEQLQAQNVKALVDPHLGREELQLFPIKPRKPTPGYISLFFCLGAVDHHGLQ